MNEAQTKKLLEEIFSHFHRKELLDTDPLGIVHQYDSKEREVVALICALFAYGRVKSMRNTLQLLFESLDRSPTFSIREWDAGKIKKNCEGIVYRFYTSEDIASFLIGLKNILKTYGSLGEAFYFHWNGDVCSSLASFQDDLKKNLPSRKLSPGLRFMISDSLKSPSKRWHMFLRWMVRNDEIDFGDWDFIPSKKLLVPLDTHLFDLSKRMHLCSRSTPSLKASFEITEQLQKYDREDPIRYDFSLCRVGVLGQKDKVFSALPPASRKMEARVKIKE